MEFFKRFSNRILVLLLISIILADVVIRLIFYTDLSAEFLNNFLSPIIQIAGFGVIFLTLLEIRKSNLDNRSQVYYTALLEKIDKVKAKAQQGIYAFNFIPNYLKIIKGVNYSVLYFDELYFQCMSLLREDQEYQDDLRALEMGTKLKWEDIVNKDYIDKMDFITHRLFIPIKIFNTEISNFFDAIEKHKYLENHHKDQLFQRIIKEIINNYLFFCKLSKEEKPPIPRFVNIKVFDVDYTTDFKTIKIINVPDEKFFTLYNYVELKENLSKIFISPL